MELEKLYQIKGIPFVCRKCNCVSSERLYQADYSYCIVIRRVMNLIKVAHLKIINKLIVLKGLQSSQSEMGNWSCGMKYSSMKDTIRL